MKKLATADQLLQALQQEKALFDENFEHYQQQLKAQLVSPATLSAAVALGVVLSFYIFPKKKKDEGVVTLTAHPEKPSFVTNLIREVAVTAIVPLLTHWLAQK